MQVLKTVSIVTNHLEKECTNGLCQHSRGLLRTDNIEKPLKQLIFYSASPAEENFQMSKKMSSTL